MRIYKNYFSDVFVIKMLQKLTEALVTLHNLDSTHILSSLYSDRAIHQPGSIPSEVLAVRARYAFLPWGRNVCISRVARL